MEKLFNTRWWDYSDKRFNVNGRICLSVAVCFGFLGVILLYFINPFLVNLLSKIPNNILIMIAIALFILLIFDFIISMIIVGKFTKHVKLVKEDSSNEINFKIREYLINKSTWFERIIKAFPDFKYLNKPSKQLKRALKEGNKIIDEIKSGKRYGYSNMDNLKNSLEKDEEKTVE